MLRPGSFILLFVAVCLPAAASTPMKSIYHSGTWSTLSGDSTGGTPMCLVVDDGNGWFLAFKYIEGNKFILAQVYKNSWTIPKGTQIPIGIQIDHFAPWKAPAVGGGKDIIWSLAGSVLTSFTAQFKVGTQLTLEFGSGNEPPWHLSLAGSYGAASALLGCVQSLQVATAQPTQQDGVPPTQPFSAKPSEPYGSPAPAPVPAPAPGAVVTPPPAPPVRSQVPRSVPEQPVVLQKL